MYDLNKEYAKNVFTLKRMENYLNPSDFQKLLNLRNSSLEIDDDLLSKVADAMLKWAISEGATHYCHWFQPLNGKTAEKHNSFIKKLSDHNIILNFSRKELLSGESDASSFPNGGLRATFEARGISTWDSSSYAFIKERGNQKVLYIPTSFSTQDKVSLDKKTPLIRSTIALKEAVIRVLKALNKYNDEIVNINIGAEQEYFLVKKEFYDKRIDLKVLGRTLFGSLSFDAEHNHYYGPINEKILLFMNDLNKELWKLGISSKTQHKEAAFNQYEVAVVYGETNISVDQNQLIMECIKDIALRHDMVALLNEKPFAYQNGSGKHNNWSISIGSKNLFKPAKNPEDNLIFLLFLTAVIAGVDKYSSALSFSISSRSNDLRLGGFEAPPNIMSIYIGDYLNNILQTIESNKNFDLSIDNLNKLGISSLCNLSEDITDRNRTSPIAFTGNKFELRLPGSSQSISDCNLFLNAAVAKSLNEIAIRLDNKENLLSIISYLYKSHKRRIFNKNNYDISWIKEASKRGLQTPLNTYMAINYFKNDKNINLLTSLKIMSEREINSRLNIAFDSYFNELKLEISLMKRIFDKSILPAAIKLMAKTKDAGPFLIKRELNKKMKKYLKQANYYKNKLDNLDITKIDEILENIHNFRLAVDRLETIFDKEDWPMPDYEDLLFNL